MGVATGCGCKEVYRFPHTTYHTTPLVSVLFYSSIPTFLKCFSYHMHKAGVSTCSLEISQSDNYCAVQHMYIAS